MMKFMPPIVGILLIMIGIGFTLYRSPVQITFEYTTKISVDKPEKIKDAISSAVSDLEKRDFVPVNLKVTWHPVSKTYVIYAMGIDRTKLDKYEP